MSDQSNVLSRVVRWGAMGLVLCVAIEPLTATPPAGAAADTAP